MNPLTRRTLIVMTATITPAQGIGNSVRVDPALRLSEYLEAFRHYASLPDELVQGILFLENSGHDLTPFRELQRTLGTRKQIEFLSTSTDYPAEKGKGYGEFLMLDQGMSHLRAQGWPGDTQVWKVTGRLIVKNMARMVRQAPPAFALYADFRHVPVLGSRLGGNEWLELRLVAFSLDGYDRHFRGHYGDGYVIERAFFDRLFPLVQTRPQGVHPRFRTQPELEGFSGYSNKSYSSLEYRMKGAIRSLTRTALPFLWI